MSSAPTKALLKTAATVIDLPGLASPQVARPRSGRGTWTGYFERYMFVAIIAIILLPLACFLVNVVRAFVLFDRLLRIQFSRDRAEWESLGSPIGYFYVPGPMSWATQIARDKLYSQWSGIPPDWITTSDANSRLYANWRNAVRMSRILLWICLGVGVLTSIVVAMCFLVSLYSSMR